MKRRNFLKLAAAGATATGMAASGIASPLHRVSSRVGDGEARNRCGESLSGPISSVRTPFLKDGEIDERGLRNFVDHVIAGGGKTVLLTAGDSLLSCMSNDEIARVTKVTAEQTAGRALVVAADNNYATRQAVEFAQYAKGVGADVLMCLPPDWADSTTAESLVEHYLAVAQHIPVMLVTNVLGKRGHEFALNVVRRAIDASSSIVAVKDDLCGEFGRKLSVLCQGTGVVAFAGGLKKNHLNVVPVDGGPCYMSPFQVGAPHITREYWAAIEKKDLARAEQIIETYEKPFFDYLLTCHGGWNAAWHGALELWGVAGRWRRKPFYSMDDQQLDLLKNKLAELKFL